jgi:hypothetical protein
MDPFIMTTRFSNETWRENTEYRNRYEFKGCIYGSHTPLCCNIPEGVGVFVIEMNNSLNRIEGIGYVRNTVRYDKYFKIYEGEDKMHFNSCVFRGQTRVDRDYIGEENPELLIILDYILFKEKTHLKRGHGITRVPHKLLIHEKCNKKNIPKEIKILFQKYICHRQPHLTNPNPIQKQVKISPQCQT